MQETSSTETQSRKRRATNNASKTTTKRPRSSTIPGSQEQEEVVENNNASVKELKEESNHLQLVNAHNNERHDIEKPKKFSQLQDQICKLFHVKKKDIERISNLSDIDINSDAELLCDETNVILFYLKKQKQASKTSITTEADIIPHVNILIHAGDEYDFITALAELIDNSIQNTCLNTGERLIDITMEKTIENNQELHRLHIFDNGRGMNYQGVVEWAKMGITRPPPVDKDILLNIPRERSEIYLTNDFSRYGVGSKKAIFNLGRQVTLCSRTNNSKLVTETTLATWKLEEDYEKGKSSQWKIQIESRTPTEQEAITPSFTHITISDLKEVYVAKYDSATVRRQLAHIYHYYIFGPKGSRSVNKDTEEISDDEDTIGYMRNVAIRVDGKSIKEKSENDLETQYLLHGMNPWSFDMKVTATIREFDTDGLSQMSQARNKIQSNIKGVIYYYPYKNGKETLPVLNESALSPDDDIPLSEREPGFECFWNGRLLSGERSIKNFPFMTKDKAREIPDICYRRIKGMLFLDSAFEVSANKLYLCKQTPLCQALIHFDDRKLKSSFRKWIKSCHLELDEEIKYGAIDTEETNKHQRGVTFYKDVTYGSQKFQVGTKVSLNTRPKTIGTITAIFLDASAQDYGCSIIISECNGEDADQETIKSTHNISKIDKILSASEFKKEKEKMAKRKPTYIDLVETAKVSINQKLPTNEPVEAGYAMKYISVAVFGGDNKIYTKECPILMRVMDDATGKVYGEVPSYKPTDKTGRYCFKPSSIIPKFTEAGKYRFEFSSDKLKPKIYTLTVTSSSPHHLILQGFPIEQQQTTTESCSMKCYLGQAIKLPIIQLADQYGNVIALSEVSISKKELVIISTSNTLNLSTDYKVSMTEQGIIIEDLVFLGGSLEEKMEETAELIVIYGQLQQKLTIPIVVYAGKPFRLEFTDITRELVSSSPVVYDIPKMELYVMDEWKNRILHTNHVLVLQAGGDNLEHPRVVSFNEKTGLFTFEGDNILTIRQDNTKTEEYTVQLTFTLLRDGEVFMFDGRTVTSTVMLTVSPSSAFAPLSIKLIPKEGQEHFLKSQYAFGAKIEAVVNEQLTDWKIQMLDHKNRILTSFNGQCSGSWDSQKYVVTNGECKMPLLMIPTEHDKKRDLKLTFNRNDNQENISIYKLEVHSIIGKPVKMKIKPRGKKQIEKLVKRCFEKFYLDFTLQDTYGNEFDMFKHKEVHEEIALITPVLDIQCIEKQIECKVSKIEEEKMELTTTSEGTWCLQNIKLKGPRCNYFLIIKDNAGIVKPASINLELLPGDPMFLRVNDLDSPVFTVFNYGTLPNLTIGAYDDAGNVVAIDESAAINMDDDDLEINYGTGDGSSAAMEIDEQGRYVVPQLYIMGKPGKHEFSLAFEGISMQVNIVVNLQPSPSHPKEIVIQNRISNSLPAGTSFGPFEVLIMSENGQPTRILRSVTLEIDAPDERRVHTSIPPLLESNNNDFTYKFPGTEKCLVKAGPYKYKFYADLAHLPYSTYLAEKDLILVKEMNFTVTNGRVANLETKPFEFQLPTVSNAEELSRRTLFDELIVVAVDNYRNISTDFNGSVSISVKAQQQSSSQEGKQIPGLEGTLVSNFENGRAKFGSISIRPNTGKSGIFKLILSCDNLEPKEMEFCFTDDAILHKKQNKLLQKKAKLGEIISEQERLLEEARIKHDEVEHKLTEYNHEIQHFKEELGQLSKDFKDKDWNSENIEKLIAVVKKKILSKKKKCQHIRTADYGLNESPSLQHVMKLREKEGESSDVIGILGDIGFIDDDEMNKIISKQLGSMMQLVIVNNRRAADLLKQTMENLPKVTILPLDNMLNEVKLDQDGLCQLEDLGKFRVNSNGDVIAKESGDSNGFLGYACNIVKLKKEHSHLRPVLFTIMRDCAIFKTYDMGLQFRRQRLYANKRCPKIITLDGQTIEAQGFVFAGKDNTTFPYRFGQMPLSADPYFANLMSRQEKLTQMKAILEKKRTFLEEEYATSEKEYKEMEKNIRKRINELMQKQQLIQEQIRKLAIGGNYIEQVADKISAQKEINDDELLSHYAEQKSKSQRSSGKSKAASQKKESAASRKTPESKKRSRGRTTARKSVSEKPESPDLFEEEIQEFSEDEERVENWSSDEEDKKTPTASSNRKSSRPKRKKTKR